MTTEVSTIALVRVADILPSPENPRRLFEEHALEELSASIRTKGIIQPLVLRPRGPFRAKGIRRGKGGAGWEVVAADEAVIYSRDDLTQAEAQRALDVCLRRHFEIVDGERRWRASLALGTVETVPAIIRTFSDTEASEVRWIAALQHEDLDPVDEARGLQRMLALRTEGGKPLYTVDLLAARLSKSPSWIWNRLTLVDLPRALAQALQVGTVSAKTCEYIGRLPTVALREEVAGKVLKPELQETPLTAEQTARLIREQYCRELRSASFDRADAQLVAEVGACTGCAHNSANQAEATGRIHLCTHIACFSKKMEAAWVKVAAKAAKEGMRVLSLEESLAIYPAHEPAGVMAAHSPWVELSWQPEDDLIKPEVLAIGGVPTWRDLVGEVAVPLVLARDQQGRAVELADRRACMEAAVVCDGQTGRNDSAIFRESPAKVKRVASSEQRVVSAQPKATKPDPVAEAAREGAAEGEAALAELDRRLEDAGASGGSSGSEPSALDARPSTPAGEIYVETIAWHRFAGSIEDLPHQPLVLATPLELINAGRNEDGEIVDSDGSPITQTIQWWALALKGPPQAEQGASDEGDSAAGAAA
jgi:ParB/RepB/Spo0J family partition protein